MLIERREVWMIMSPDYKIVAKGVPRERTLVHVDEDDGKRFLTYTSKAKAEAAFLRNGFYTSAAAYKHALKNAGECVHEIGGHGCTNSYVDWKDYLKAVKCIQTIEIAEEDDGV